MEDGYEIMKILSIDEAKKLVPSGDYNSRKQKVVVITGVTGQDGSFMADYLLKNTDYILFGGARRLSVYNHANVEHLDGEDRFHLINFDLTDAHSISQIVSQLQPNYFINFAAQSFVKSSWDFPAQTWETNTTGVLNILEAVRLHCPQCRFYNAGSSEEFGNIVYSPQDENHPLRPRSPYGASKAGARQIVKVYRESYNLYAIQGWLFNHEGVRRGEEFVTRKITLKVGEIAAGLAIGMDWETLELGNLDAKRDWSDAEDMVDAIWKMLNQGDKPQEYVVASGESHTVREFVTEAFKFHGIKGEWFGKGLYETYAYKNLVLVRVNPAFYRPAEVDVLQGNPNLIKVKLGWTPKTSFKGLVEKMARRDSYVPNSTLR